MLSHDDRDAIESLFSRLEEAERRGGPRNHEADELIGRLLRRQPAAPYYLAQTVVVQQHALNEADRRIRELEDRPSSRSAPARRNPWGDPAPAGYEPPAAYGRGYGRSGFGGSGFLAGAAQTALGVAGGVLLGEMIGSVFSAGSAHAADGFGHDVADAASSDVAHDAGSNADIGGSDAGPGDGIDSGGFDGGFDTGGGF